MSDFHNDNNNDDQNRIGRFPDFQLKPQNANSEFSFYLIL